MEGVNIWMPSKTGDDARVGGVGETWEESAERKWTQAKCNCTNDDVEYWEKTEAKKTKGKAEVEKLQTEYKKEKEEQQVRFDVTYLPSHLLNISL